MSATGAISAMVRRMRMASGDASSAAGSWRAGASGWTGASWRAGASLRAGASVGRGGFTGYRGFVGRAGRRGRACAVQRRCRGPRGAGLPYEAALRAPGARPPHGAEGLRRGARPRRGLGSRGCAVFRGRSGPWRDRRRREPWAPRGLPRPGRRAVARPPMLGRNVICRGVVDERLVHRGVRYTVLDAFSGCPRTGRRGRAATPGAHRPYGGDGRSRGYSFLPASPAEAP